MVVRDRSADQLWNVLGNVTTPHSAVVARRGALRFTANGEVAVDGGGVSTFDPSPGGRTRGRSRAAVAGAGRKAAVPLPLWADAADLSPQLARAAVLHADARLATTAEDGAVTLAAGEFCSTCSTARRGCPRARSARGHADGLDRRRGARRRVRAG
ncbi:MAG: hypothetical protein U0168_24055 [Nannocystaceae bacterium]